MFFLTTLILANFDAAPPETLATRSVASSAFMSSSSFSNSLEVFARSSYALSFVMAGALPGKRAKGGLRPGDGDSDLIRAELVGLQLRHPRKGGGAMSLGGSMQRRACW
eukprot:CAMPEP_0176043622 /NCGR_PEP_ID=MMETSP0120_2-20121206/21650_1 /TAXON_ID=160619 /ORGANISM="Kryptoperidinium foliaceum, Strain CCMP 1326" /LENGTH=108 /DNA_ID=CAMNT_0017377033 /DNA_START=213 /DNA_END=539 /DNA_ORIENTATION=-